MPKAKSHIKSFIKGITYRLYSTVITILISFGVTGSTKSAFAIGGVELFVKVFTYYIHERVWNYILKRWKK